MGLPWCPESDRSLRAAGTVECQPGACSRCAGNDCRKMAWRCGTSRLVRYGTAAPGTLAVSAHPRAEVRAMSEHAQQRHPHSEPEDDGDPGRAAGTPGHVRGQGQLDGRRAPRPGGPAAPAGDSRVTGDEPAMMMSSASPAMTTWASPTWRPSPRVPSTRTPAPGGSGKCPGQESTSHDDRGAGRSPGAPPAGLRGYQLTGGPPQPVRHAPSGRVPGRVAAGG